MACWFRFGSSRGEFGGNIAKPKTSGIKTRRGKYLISYVSVNTYLSRLIEEKPDCTKRSSAGALQNFLRERALMFLASKVFAASHDNLHDSPQRPLLTQFVVLARFERFCLPTVFAV